MITLEIKNLDIVRNTLAKYPAVSEKRIGTAIQRSLVRVLGEEKKTAPFGVSGGLRDRWSIKLGRFTGSLVSGVKYGMGVEKGTKPHAVPVSAIAPWAIKKGLNPWAVVNSIKKKGTKANPFFERAVGQASKGVEQEFSDAVRDILGEIKH